VSREELLLAEDPDILAIFGHDKRVFGWFCEVRHRGRLVGEYPVPGDGKQGTVAGVLLTLVEWGFVSHGALTEARGWLGVIDDLSEIESPEVRRAAEVIITLREMGAEDF